MFNEDLILICLGLSIRRSQELVNASDLLQKSMKFSNDFEELFEVSSTGWGVDIESINCPSSFDFM